MKLNEFLSQKQPQIKWTVTFEEVIGQNKKTGGPFYSLCVKAQKYYGNRPHLNQDGKPQPLIGWVTYHSTTFYQEVWKQFPEEAIKKMWLMGYRPEKFRVQNESATVGILQGIGEFLKKEDQ